MEKRTIKDKADLERAIVFFSQVTDQKQNVLEAVPSRYPYVLCGFYSDDIEFGSGWTFGVVQLSDFEKLTDSESLSCM